MLHRIAIVASHPVQYHAPLYRELDKLTDLKVYFAHRTVPADHEAGEFGVAFEWDLNLTEGYDHEFLTNRSSRPGFNHFMGCNTPDVLREIQSGGYSAFLVQGWNLYSYWQTIVGCRRNRVPVMIRGDSHLNSPRSVFRRILKRPVYLQMMKQFSRCLYVGQRNKKYFKNYGVPEEKLVFSPHSVDNAWFGEQSCKHDKMSLRRRYGIKEDAIVILFAGKLVSRKRPLDLVHAVSHMKQRIEVLFAGSGELADQIRKVAEELNVRIHLLGFRNQSQMPAVYAAADVLVLPSDSSETWGLVVNEAMASGIPTIVSDQVGCAPDLIDNGQTGYIYPTGNISALADRLRNLFIGPASGIKKEHISSKISKYTPQATAAGIVTALESIKNQPS